MYRVMVTGIGAITPIGINAPDMFTNLLAGRCGIADYRHHPKMREYRPRPEEITLAGLLPDDAIAGCFSTELLQSYDPQTLVVLAAAQEAFADAQFTSANHNPALIVGSVAGPRPAVPRLRQGFRVYSTFDLNVYPQPHYYAKNFIDEFAISTITRAIAETCARRSLALPLSSICTSGASALALGYELIQGGIVDSALAVGFDFFNPRQSLVFSHFRLLDTGPIRPFDSNRTGYQLGEAVGAVLLEKATTVGCDGVGFDKLSQRCYAEIIGVGATNDGYHPLIPDPTGRSLFQAMQQALTEAEIEPAQLSHLAAIGRGSPQADQSEGRAISRLLGKNVGDVPLNSLVPNTGYTLGSSSIINFIALMLEMRHNVLFPTLNVQQVDTRIGKFDLVQNTPRPYIIDTALSLSTAFFGSNVAIAVRRTEDGEQKTEGREQMTENGGKP